MNMERRSVVAFAVGVVIALAAHSSTARATPCKPDSIPQSRDLHSFEDSHGQYYLQSPGTTKTFHLAANCACKWTINSIHPIKNAVVAFHGGSPFADSVFYFTHAKPVCAGVPVVAPSTREYQYTITVVEEKGGNQTVDPGIIIDGPEENPPSKALTHSTWKFKKVAKVR
jgi:hypothetical protein